MHAHVEVVSVETLQECSAICRTLACRDRKLRCTKDCTFLQLAFRATGNVVLVWSS